MDTPGKLLKAGREKKERSLEELAELLKLKVAYLKAIEEGDYLSIPGEVFIKGYIRVYANALGLDSNYILNLYKKQVVPTLWDQSRVTKTSLAERPIVSKNKFFTPLERKPFTPLEKFSNGASPSFLMGFTFKPVLIIASAFFLIVISLVVFTTREEEKSVTKSLRLVVATLWDQYRLPDEVEEEVEATLFASVYPTGRRRLVERIIRLSESAKAETRLKRDPLRVIESQALTEKGQERFSLNIATTKFTWISVVADSSMPTVRFLKPGEVVKWTALNGFSVKIGNAAGARLTFNGKDLGNLGPPGKVVKLVLPENKNTQKSDG